MPARSAFANVFLKSIFPCPMGTIVFVARLKSFRCQRGNLPGCPLNNSTGSFLAVAAHPRSSSSLTRFLSVFDSMKSYAVVPSTRSHSVA